MIRGTLLAESLRPGTDIQLAGLSITRVARKDVSRSASGRQPGIWTFLDFEAADEIAEELGHALAESLASDGGWYADFSVGQDHVVVFANRVFRYQRGDEVGRAEAVGYGRTVGVPEHQLDWTD